METFEVGDRVRIIEDRYTDFSCVGYVQEIEHGEYRVTTSAVPNGIWHQAQGLSLVQRADAASMAIGKQPPAAETGARGDVSDEPGVSSPFYGEGFDEWVDRVGRSVENTAYYWRQIAADNLELGSRGMDDRDNTIAELRDQLAAAEAANERLANALEPFAEAWLQVPYGLRSSLRIWNGELDEDSKYPIIGSISTDTLQDAHTAWAGLPEANGSGEGAG